MARVILWSSHRCASTAFERSIRELDTVRVLHEPHCLAFFCEDGIRLRDDADSVFEAKREYILSQMRHCPSEGYNYIFIKELAYFVSGRYEEYIQGEFATFEHSFLVRDPMSVALSLHRVSKAQGRMPFFTDTLGFRELYDMHQMAKKGNKKPVVISVEDVFSNPRCIGIANNILSLLFDA